MWRRIAPNIKTSHTYCTQSPHTQRCPSTSAFQLKISSETRIPFESRCHRQVVYPIRREMRLRQIFHTAVFLFHLISTVNPLLNAAEYIPTPHVTLQICLINDHIHNITVSLFFLILSVSFSCIIHQTQGHRKLYAMFLKFAELR